MVSAAARVDAGGAAEFAQNADDGVVEHPAIAEIFDQRGEGPIELRAEETFVVGIGVVQAAAVGVHVPAGDAEDGVEVVDGDVAAAAFDQPPSHQAALAQRVAAVAVALLRGLLREVEGLLGFGRGQQVEGSRVGGVAADFGVGLGLLLHLVDLREQLLASVEPELGLPGGRLQVRDFEVRASRVRAEEERLVSTAEIRGRLPVQRTGSGVADLVRQDDRRRQRAATAEDFRDHRAAVRLHAVRVEVVPGHHPALAVFVSRSRLVMQAANQRDLVHHARHQRKVLADLNAGDVRVDRLEFSSDLRRSLRLHVPRIELPRRSNQKNRDAVPNFLLSLIDRPARFQRHPSRQRQANHPRRPRLQKAAPSRSVTITERYFFIADVKHGSLPLVEGWQGPWSKNLKFTSNVGAGTVVMVPIPSPQSRMGSRCEAGR